ncbi:MAG: hypothetical protein ACTSWA_07415 [Candidatus Thorarchaeota archaeon]
MNKYGSRPFDKAVTDIIASRHVTREEAEQLVVELEKRRLTPKERREFQKRVKQYSRPGKQQAEAEMGAVKNIMNSRPVRDYIRRAASKTRH